MLSSSYMAETRGIKLSLWLSRYFCRWGRLVNTDAQCTLEGSAVQSASHSVMSDSLRPHGLHSPWNSLDKNTGVGSLSLLQWIFLIQESNWGLLHCRWILYQLSYQGWFSVIAVYPSYLFSLLSSGDIKKVWTCMKLWLVGFQELAGSRESPS